MIIFDLDGTLWNTVDRTLEAANKIAEEHEDIKEFKKKPIVDSMGLSKKETAVIYMPYLQKRKAIKYINEINAVNVKIIRKKGATLYKGVIPSIKKLSKKYKLGIVTNNTDDYAKIFIKTSKLGKYFSDYMGAATYNITKAEAIKRMCNRNKEPNSFYIGDIKKDMIATKEAGMTFIHAKYGFEPNVSCKYHINSIRELEPLIKEINENSHTK